MVPGIMCFVLVPGLKNPDEAYMTLVTNYLPAGLTGFIISILIAGLISTIDSGLNSFSTIFTLDIYIKNFRPQATQKEITSFGRIITGCAALAAILFALWFGTFGKGIFNLAMGLIAFFAPPISAVFLISVLWKRATSAGAFWSLLLGTILSLSIGVCHFNNYPSKEFWPHYLVLSFYIFAAICALFVIVSVLTKNSPDEEQLPTLAEVYTSAGGTVKSIWVGWAALAVIMLGIYIIF